MPSGERDDDETSRAREPAREPPVAPVRWPLLRDDRPRSVRWPWSRSVLGVGVGLLLPFVWVVEANECGSHTTTELTGSALVQALPADQPDLGGIGIIVLLSLAAPWIAAAMVREGPRLLALGIGALSSLVTTLFGTGMLLFTVFATRTLRPAGYGVMALLVTFALDGFVRLGLGVYEWRVARRARAARPAARTE